MTDTSSPGPATERTIDFYGDPITIIVVSEDEVFVPVRPITEFLGLDWSSQLQRIRRDEVLERRVAAMHVTAGDGVRREMICLPLDLLPGWLFGLSPSRVKPEIAPKLQRYREECFRVLWRAFQADALSALRGSEASVLASTGGLTALTQIRALGLAVAQMAEQQLVAEQRLTTHEGRLDRAALVIKAVQTRLDALEEQMTPAAFITEAQAAELTMLVRAVAQALTAQNPAKNHYQGVFAELYRRFQVTSYKLVQQEQFPAVVAFLQEWQATLATGSTDTSAEA